jgi:hypothetical protein
MVETEIMKIDNAEFYVRDVQKDQFGVVVVVGIPNNGEPIKVGDIFKLRYELDRDDVLSGAINPSRKNCFAVKLTVDRIDFMREPVEQLPHGMTGGLYLTGDFMGVVPTCYLRT